MKKILSIIMAISMCISLFGATAKATETANDDGVISYRITADVIRKDAFAGGTHNIATDEDGKLKFGTSSVDATVFNVLANLQGTRATNDKKIGNAETAFVTYRTLNYNMYKTTATQPQYTPIRVNASPVTGLEQENGVAKVYTMPETLNLAVTAPYELMGRNYHDNNHGLVSAGVYETLKVLSVNGEKVTNNMDDIAIRKPGFIVKIKVEKPGVYKLKAYNNCTVGSSSSVDYKYIKELGSGALYNVDIASECNVYILPVPEKGFELEYSNAGKPTYARVNGKRDNTWRDDAVKLSGTYSSYPGSEQLFEDSLELAEGEYLVHFEVNKEAVDTTNYSDVYLYGSNYYQNFVLSGIDLIPTVSEEEIAMRNAAEEAEEVEEVGLSENSYINVISKNIEADGSVAEVKKIPATRGDNVTITADEISGYDFLYWRRGLGAGAKVITSNPECTVKAVPGAWITAVYKAEDSEKVSVLFYNADGDIIKNELVVKDSEITFPIVPDAPSGCGAFVGWALNTKDNIVSSATATGDSMVFVAQFEESAEKNIAIAVPNDANGGGSYAYGETVTVIAASERDGKNFAYWKKGEEVASFDSSYTFNAWENSELTAVYLSKVPELGTLRKIIISGGIAEFIGLDSAVEKGIIFRDIDESPVTIGNATHKVAMMTDGNHLSFINDLENSGETNYMGYAILANGNVIYDK
ncbi:MAG: hypothetical protein E7473_10335 [Ruminococcaceae bacterium]|nr:hypothetical protein [Oscillospiraceae bacterium]